MGYDEKCLELIEQIPADSAELALGLKKLVREYEFDKLMMLSQNLEESNDHPG